MTVAMVAASLIAVLLAGCGEDSSADPGTPVTEGFPLYGPGPHWIDTVRSGTVTFGAVAVVGVDLNADSVEDLTVEARGHTTVFRSDARANDPADLRHRNHLDLEIVDMLLEAEGMRFTAGDGTGNFTADSPLFSLGTSDEIVHSPELAHDDFAIYFAGVIGQLAVHNREPLRMVATIDRLPPIGNAFELSGPPLPLLTESGDPAGVQITSVTYTPLESNE